MERTAHSRVAAGILGTAVVALAAGASPPADRAAIGAPAPALTVEEVLAGPDLGAWTPGALAGRAVVVDFWSTWCAPCVEDMPRWNAMVDELAGDPVVFVSVSDEPAEVVRRFLAERRLAGWVAVDTDGSMFQAFDARSRPQAVLIDAAGVVRGIGHTGEVTPAMVRRLLAGEETGLVPAPGTDELLAEAGRSGAAEAIFQVGLWPTGSATGQLTSATDHFIAVGVGLRILVPFLWEVPVARVRLDDGLPPGRFDLVVRPAGDATRVRPLGREAIESGLGLAVRREMLEVDALVLRKAAGDGAPPLRPADLSAPARLESGPGRLLGNRVHLSAVAEELEGQLRRPVVDETGLAGAHEFELVWDAGAPEALVAAVEGLGFELVEARREVEMLVVERREPAP